MGLEAMLPREIPENIRMNIEKTSLELSSPISISRTPLSATTFDNSSAEAEVDSDNQMQLLLQAHALLKKGRLYQLINGALKRSMVFRPNVSQLPQTLELQDGDERETVTTLHRDAAVSNIRFFNIFYGLSAKTFALAVNLLDRVICKVKAHPKYLSCIATSCFYIAAQTQEQNVFIPMPAELVKLSQCAGGPSDLFRMQSLILEKVEGQVEAVTPLTFLLLFHELFANSGDERLSSPGLLNSLIAKLEVLMCQFEFAKYRAETLALALLSCMLQDTGALQDLQHLSALVELQYYCQMSDAELLQCRNLVVDYLQMYISQPSKLPRLHLVWAVSRRTMNKMKPSTKVLLDLEPIWEDEDIEDEADTGKFDSENSDSELEKRNQIQQAISHLPTTVPRPPCILPLNHNAAAATATTECNSAAQSFTSAALGGIDDKLSQGDDHGTCEYTEDDDDEVFIINEEGEDASKMKTPAGSTAKGFLDSDANNNIKLKEEDAAVSNKVEENDSKSNM